MDLARLESLIEAAFDDRDNINSSTQGDIRDAVNATLDALDSGALRVAEKQAVGQWTVNQWAKKAVLLGFRLNDMAVMDGACGGAPGWDKVRAKVRRLGPGTIRGRWLPRRSRRYRPPLSAHRQGRRADAVVRQPGRFR